MDKKYLVRLVTLITAKILDLKFPAAMKFTSLIKMVVLL